MENGNESAFPVQGNSASGELEGGLTKREMFAAMAMQGMLSNSVDCNQGTQPLWYGSNEQIAKGAIMLADELLKQLSHDPR